MKNVASIRIFGSSARGDSDLSSDMDLLVVYKHAPLDSERKRVLGEVSGVIGRNIDLSEYSSERIRQFFYNGDLFSWHLFQESKKIIFIDNDLIDDLGRPAPYSNTKEDICSFITLLKSIPNNLIQYPESCVFEGGLLYLATRNIAMSLSWHLDGHVDFSRHAALNVTERLDQKFPISVFDYNELINCRHASQRGAVLPSISPVKLAAIAVKLVDWSTELQSLIHTRRIEGSYANTV